MSEDEARDWLTAHFPAPAIARLERFVGLLREESVRQSLIARSTFAAVWSRHIADSAQLVTLAPSDGDWLDIGSGGGLPGIVVAILRDAPILLSEPRRKRVAFLERAIYALDLGHATATLTKTQQLSGRFAVVSARAVAPIADIFMWTRGIVSRETRFLLPRGRSWRPELEITERAWHGAFHVEQSLTDLASGIVIADSVSRR